jgi:2-dehydro-3-deoxygluconokinase
MIICFGEIMLRLTPPNNLRFSQATLYASVFGGSESNVAVSLAQFGADVAFVTRVPNHDLGRVALSDLRRNNVQTQLAVYGGERLGMYFLEMGMGNRASKIIYDRTNSGMASLERGMIDWETVFSNATWFHWSGITPAISATAADATLEAIEVANRMGIKVSCDLNYRGNLWQYDKHPNQIMPQLMAGCDVMLGDGDTMHTYFGIKGADYTEIIEKTFLMFPKLQHLAMTARKSYHASHNAYKGFLHNRTALFESREYDVPDILDRIGAGDAFMGALIFCLEKNTPPQYAVEFAAAASTLKHAISGDVNLVSVAEVEALMGGNTGGKVNR